MPMNLTVSRNRKTSKNYNSEGFGVSLTVELDQSLLTQPNELQKKIDYLYREADAALDQQASDDNGDKVNSDRSGGNDNRPRSNARNGNTITQAQRRAVHAIAKRLGLDVADECHHELGKTLDELTVRQASEFIDHLKALEQPASRNGGGR